MPKIFFLICQSYTWFKILIIHKNRIDLIVGFLFRFGIFFSPSFESIILAENKIQAL